MAIARALLSTGKPDLWTVFPYAEKGRRPSVGQLHSLPANPFCEVPRIKPRKRKRETRSSCCHPRTAP
jgi:hypothetical protein